MDKQIFKIKYIFYLSFLIILLISLGFLREYVFISVNEQLKFLLHPFNNKKLSSFFLFLEKFSYTQLYAGKWILTVLFSVLYLLLNSWILWVIFNNKKMILWMLYMYGIIIVIASLFLMSGYFFNNYEKGYDLSRIFMGFAQSPIPLMLFVPAVKLFSLSEKGN